MQKFQPTCPVTDYLLDLDTLAIPSSTEAATIASNLTVIFEGGKCRLPERETNVLKQWVSSWCSAPQKFHLLIGGALETSRVGRLRRLAWLSNQFELHGVSNKRIHPDEDWLRPSRMGFMDDLPYDLVWLKLCDSKLLKKLSNVL